MTKDSLITEIYTSKEIGEVILKIQPEHLRDDLKQHVFLLLLEKEEEFILELHKIGKLKNYIIKILFQLVHFKKDKFHTIYGKNTEGKCIEVPFDFSIASDKYQIPIESDGNIERENDCISELDKIKGIEFPSQTGKKCGSISMYHGVLLERYVEKGNYRAVAEETGIPVKSVYNAVQMAKNEIKKRVCQL
jgi:hypothetical protein